MASEVKLVEMGSTQLGYNKPSFSYNNQMAHTSLPGYQFNKNSYAPSPPPYRSTQPAYNVPSLTIPNFPTLQINEKISQQSVTQGYSSQNGKVESLGSFPTFRYN